MKWWISLRQSIIYLLLLVFMVTASGLGLDEKRQVFLSCNRQCESTLSKQIFTVSNDLHTLELRDNTVSLSTIRGMKNRSSGTSERNSLLLLLILVVFAGIYRLLHPFCMKHARCAIDYQMQSIRYIHNIDGRKRVSNSQ